MTDLDALDRALAEQETAAATPTGAASRSHRHTWAPSWTHGAQGAYVCTRKGCGKVRDEVAARRGKNSRSYGNRAELSAARLYGGQKVGHAGGPVDIRGAEWHVQVKTHRRLPPAEWRKVFAALEASSDRLPRLLLRFLPGPGLPPIDYFVIPGKAWLDWWGRDE